nr:substrate-binding domain-containing protein [Motilibacter peucedani]
MTSAPTGRATLADVAASAGVSVATVSKVLNGRSDVSASTRARVLELLNRHDYVGRRPDPVEAPTVELFFQGELTSYSTEVIQGVLDEASELDVSVVLSVRAAGSSGSAPASWAREAAAAGRRAVIGVTNEMTERDLAALNRVRLPMVVIDPLNTPQARMASVGSTNFAGGIAATQHLLSLGHRRIAYLGGPAQAGCNQARMLGFRGAMEAAGAEVPAGYVRTGPFRYEEGVRGGYAVFDLPTPPTAVFAGNDELALGVIEAARSRGLRVPEDLSVVGFDDTQVARLSSPPLTTVRQPLREMGAVALRTALRLASGGKVDSHHVELATELVVRRSTCPLRD